LIDFVVLDPGYRKGDSAALNFPGKTLSLEPCELFGIVDPFGQIPKIEDACGGNHRAGYRSAPYFIGARDKLRAVSQAQILKACIAGHKGVGRMRFQVRISDFKYGFQI
jgi:hypothetical protein